MDRQVKGILGAKLGMTQVWDNNKVVPVTVVQAGPCVVTQVRTADKDGYSAVQLAYGAIDPRKVNKPKSGPLRQGRASRRAGTSSSCAPPTPASTSSARRSPSRRSRPGAPIDVTGQTKGKGFAGVMKRHGFHGLKASHGVERKHRSPGSIGACATPGRVFKGVRMAGRMGGRRYTVQNLTVQAVDPEQQPAAGQGRHPRPQGRAGPGPHRGQDAGEEGRCVSERRLT